ncbi:hypothetical protein DWV90_18040 [Ruminococcus sp. AF13-37]|nr:hypothetical protein DWV90_18040 [Ruminococcus sp. AF13-37]
MTKIKNTKKGMAKKTLSMSLVVAMLATSNVPVWAAEFSDGTDDVAVATEAPAAETFSDETAEAPVVEDTTAEAASANTVVEEGDLKVDITVDKTEVTWGDHVTVSGTITKTTDNTPLKSWNYGIREAGTTQALGTIKTATTASDMSFNTDETMAGKTIELYIYRDDANASFGPIVVGTIKVNKKNIKNATIKISGVADDATATMAYNGRVQDAASVGDIMLGSTKLTSDDYDMTVSSATNAGDILTVTVTAKGDKYVGTATRNVKIVKKTYTANKDIEAKVKDDIKYEYTGSKIYLKASDVTVAESKHDPDVTPDDQKLGGADLSSAIESVETNADVNGNYNVGKHAATVRLETGKLGNFNFSGAYESVPTSNTYEIVARDLSKVKVVVGSNGEVQLNTAVAALPLAFYDGSQRLNLKSADYSYTVKDPDGKVVTGTTFDKEGTYTVEITAADGVSNTKNSVSTTFRVEGNVIDSATSTGFNNTNGTIKYVKDYTGSAIQPTKDDIGTVTITGKDSNKTVTLQKGEWEIVGYSNNTEASTYGSTTATQAPYSYKKYASVQIKVTQSGTFYGKTCNLYFEIAPLRVSSDTINVPKTTSYDKSNKNASDYKLDVTVNAKDSNGKTVAVPASAYTTTSKFVKADGSDGENTIDDKIQTTVVLKNHNYIYGNYDENGKTQSVPVSVSKATTIKAPVLTNASVVLTQDSYTYTGGKITPSFKVMDGTLELQEDVDYRIKSITNAVNVGTATITVEGLGTYYSGEASGTFTITPAKVEDVKVTADAKTYTGKKIKPTSFKATLNGNDVSDQFKLSAYGDNTNAGKTAGSLTIALLSGNKNFTGSTVDGTFEIKARKVNDSTISVYDKYGQLVNDKYDTATVATANLKTFTYDGKAQTFASAKLNVGNVVTETGETASNIAKPTADDFELVYVDNVYGKSTQNATYNTAHIYAVAKEGGNYTGTKTITTADGTVIKNVVADLTFGISALKFVKENVTVKNGVYAGGVAVKPEVIVQFGGNTLVEGVDYKLDYDTATEVTNGAKYDVKVTGINGYASAGSVSSKDADPIAKWGIDKQTIANCEVSVKDGVATVMNGSVKVPADEYTSTKNDDGTYTIAAKSTSKHYTGSKTVKADGKAENEKPDAPMISNVKVVGNKATVILSGESEGAAGYDYVISTDRDCITNKDYTSVNKNQVKTNTTFEYVGQNTYYAYCHAWKRDENGKKVFSDWSNAYPFVVSAITPSQPVITSVKVKGSTVTVTYTKASNADGYDVVLGTSTKKVNGETRPVEYGKLVKKNIKGNVVTATFKNVKKGTYYAGLHAFNKTSEDGKKVFSQWSNVKKVNVK